MPNMKNFRSRHSRKPRKKRYYRGKIEKPRFQHPQARFPRMLRYPRFPKGHEDDLQLLPLLRRMRTDYPPPYYDPFSDGCFNPAERVISWVVGLNIPDLKERCIYHGLSDKGTRFEMIKRMYLHYRSRRLELGFPLVAYGLEHENENPPRCDCGKVRKESKKIRRFPRLPIKRFPRLPIAVNVGRLQLTDPKKFKQWMEFLHHDPF